MSWYKIISYLINASIAIVICQTIYDKLTEFTKAECWGLALGTFLVIYYSCKTAIDDTRSDSK